MRVKVEYFEGSDGQWYFRLKARNGEQVAASEGYSSKSNAQRAVKDLKTMLVDLAHPEGEGNGPS